MQNEATTARPAALSLVVGLGFNDADGPAFDDAVRTAKRVVNSEIHLVHVFDAEPSAERSRELIAHLRLYVNEKAATTQGIGAARVGIHLRVGNPSSELSRLAREVGAALIVIGSHTGPKLKSWIVGTTAEQLVQEAPCAVLVATRKPAAKQEPTIEPACPDCVQARLASRGGAWWCSRHAASAKTAHTYSYHREIPFATHDSEVIPTGISF